MSPAPAAKVTAVPANVSWEELPEPAEPAEPPRPAPPRERWYGGQILASDGCALLLTVAGGPVTLLGPIAFVLAPPTIHLLHGQPTRALLSAGMLVGLPLAGVLLGLEAARGCPSGDDGSIIFCEFGSLSLGVVGGFGTAIALDAAFAYEPSASEQTSWHILPQLLVSEREKRFGIVGSF